MKTKNDQLDLLTRYVLSEDHEERTRLGQQLREMLEEQPEAKTTIKSVLKDLGVPNQLKGYKYLIRAIEMQTQAKHRMKYTVEVYGGIAKEFDTTPSRVERAMRHCVETGISRADWDMIHRYFGCSIDPNRGKPTLQHFICRVAEVVEDGE